MKLIISISTILLWAVVSHGQTLIDTMYFNDKYIKVSKSEATKIAHNVQKDSFLTVTEYNTSRLMKSRIEYRVRNKGKKSEYKVIYGLYENYHDNGQLKTKAHVVNGNWNGTLMTYYDNGKPIRIETYDNYSLISSKCMDRTGKEIA
jgi:antitoxin component YwqK of YwqJK toxin-antitoxin module